MAPLFQREIATDEFLPSALYRVFDTLALTPMRRPKAIRSPGTGLKLHARSAATTSDGTVARARAAPVRSVYVIPRSPLAAAAINTTRCVCCEPIHGISSKLTQSAPTTPPSVFAA